MGHELLQKCIRRSGESGHYLVARLPGNVVVVNIKRGRRWLHLAQANRWNVGLVPVQPSRWEEMSKERVSVTGERRGSVITERSA